MKPQGNVEEVEFNKYFQHQTDVGWILLADNPRELFEAIRSHITPGIVFPKKKEHDLRCGIKLYGNDEQFCTCNVKLHNAAIDLFHKLNPNAVDVGEVLEEEKNKIEEQIMKLKEENESVLHLDRYDKERKRVLDRTSKKIEQLNMELKSLVQRYKEKEK